MALVAAGRDKGRLAEAEQAFRKAIELGGSEQDLAPYNLAAALSQEERFAEAAETARSYLKSAPTGAAATPARVLICGLRREGKIAPPEWASSSPVKLPPPGKATEARGPSDQSPVSRPVKLSGPQPPAPAKLEKQGTVIIDSIIDEEGCVVRSRVLESLTPELDQISLDTLRFWVFQPATFQGKPVKVYYTLTVNYRKGR